MRVGLLMFVAALGMGCGTEPSPAPESHTPPIDGLAVQRFSVHMLQHEMLMLIGVPLLIAGRPLATWLWGVLPACDRWRLARSKVPLSAVSGAH
jgi:hypothetical protein